MNLSFYVDWTDPVSDSLAVMWATSTDPDRLVFARNAIQYLLRTNPHKHGTPVAEGLFKLALPPLQVYFAIDRRESLEWHKWVEAHQERLIAIGIPREVWEDKSVWQRFLWHGYSSEPSDWRNFRFSMDDLDEAKLRSLHQFLAEYGAGPGCCGSTVWDDLQRRFAPTDVA